MRRIILPDLPAHGFSGTPRNGVRGATILDGLTEALDAVLDEPAVFFGNSLGGIAAIRYALSRPDRVRGLILCSPTGAAMNEREIARFTAMFRIETHAAALDFVDRVTSKRSALRQVLAWDVRRRFQLPEMRALIDSMAPRDLLSPEQLGALRPPVLLVWGRDERILPPSHLEFFRNHLPSHAHVEEPHGVGHAPYLEDPRRVARDILRFVEQIVLNQDLPKVPGWNHARGALERASDTTDTRPSSNLIRAWATAEVSDRHSRAVRRRVATFGAARRSRSSTSRGEIVRL